MAYGLQSQTYNYETLLNIINSSQKGLTVSEMKRDYGIHPKYDIKGALTWRGINKLEKAGEEPHIINDKVNTTVSRYSLSKSGKLHLRENAHLIQEDLENIQLFWKEGHNPDAPTPRQVNMPYKTAPTPKAPPPISLSKKAQKAHDDLNEAIVINHAFFAAIEEIGATAQSILIENEIDEELIAKGGGVGEVLNEAVIFKDLLQSFLEQVAPHLEEDDEF